MVMSAPWYSSGGVEIHLGNCRDVLPTLPAHSVAAMVTDPPAGISFMGKAWDDFKTARPGQNNGGFFNHSGDSRLGGHLDRADRRTFITFLTEIFTECRRVLKPGAHALVWALPRTSHWTATALEDAGFEVRDVVTHLFGSGFPKSLSVGKALDKAAGAERMVVGQNRNRIASTHTTFGDDNWKGIGQAMYDETTPATDLARQWDGWGTALKPASEHWILCRAPLSESTIAGNVARWGTGALNVDGARIGTDQMVEGRVTQRAGGVLDYNGRNMDGSTWRQKPNDHPAVHTGRWPPNCALSHQLWCTDDGCAPDCPVALLDAQSGAMRARGNVTPTQRATSFWGNGRPDNTGMTDGGDTGGASRFFYVAKASAAERSRGLPEGERNMHPTVKPLALMKWLLTLVTPPNGTILDPFAGSGSTLVAAADLGITAIGIEQDADSCATAVARLGYSTGSGSGSGSNSAANWSTFSRAPRSWACR